MVRGRNKCTTGKGRGRDLCPEKKNQLIVTVLLCYYCMDHPLRYINAYYSNLITGLVNEMMWNMRRGMFCLSLQKPRKISNLNLLVFLT